MPLVPNRRMAANDAIGRGWPSGKLSITLIQARQADVTYPDIEIAVGRPCVGTARSSRLDGVVVVEPASGGTRSRDTVCRVSAGIHRRQLERDPCVSRQRRERCRGSRYVRVAFAKVLVEDRNLAVDLRLTYVFGRVPMHDMHHDRNFGATGSLRHRHHLGTKCRLLDPALSPPDSVRRCREDDGGTAIVLQLRSVGNWSSG